MWVCIHVHMSALHMNKRNVVLSNHDVILRIVGEHPHNVQSDISSHTDSYVYVCTSIYVCKYINA